MKYYYEKVNSKNINYKIDVKNVIADNGKVCIYYEKLYGSTHLCATFASKVFQAYGNIDKIAIKPKKEYYIKNINKIAKSNLKYIADELLKLNVVTLNTVFKEDNINVKIKTQYTVQELIEC